MTDYQSKTEYDLEEVLKDSLARPYVEHNARMWKVRGITFPLLASSAFIALTSTMVYSQVAKYNRNSQQKITLEQNSDKAEKRDVAREVYFGVLGACVALTVPSLIVPQVYKHMSRRRRDREVENMREAIRIETELNQRS